MSMRTRTVLITGGSEGLGCELARMHHRIGDSVIVIGRRDARHTPAFFRTAPAITYVQCNLSDANADLRIRTFLHNNGMLLDVLYLNAAMGYYGTYEAQPINQIYSLLATTLLSPILLLNSLHAAIRPAAYVKIISSVVQYAPHQKYALYAAAKAALAECMYSVKYAHAAHYRPAVLCPGAMATSFHKKSGMGQQHIPFLQSPQKVAQSIYRKRHNATIGLHNKMFHLWGTVQYIYSIVTSGHSKNHSGTSRDATGHDDIEKRNRLRSADNVQHKQTDQHMMSTAEAMRTDADTPDTAHTAQAPDASHTAQTAVHTAQATDTPQTAARTGQTAHRAAAHATQTPDASHTAQTAHDANTAARAVQAPDTPQTAAHTAHRAAAHATQTPDASHTAQTAHDANTAARAVQAPDTPQTAAHTAHRAAHATQTPDASHTAQTAHDANTAHATTASTTSKSILIIGAAEGLGFELAKIYIAAGMHLILVDYNKQLLKEQYQQFLALHGTHIVCIRADMRSKKGIRTIAQQIAGAHISHIYITAAVSAVGAFHNIPRNTILQVYKVNCAAIAEIIARVYQEKDAPPCKIILFSSLAIFLHYPCAAVYSATKAFLSALSRALRHKNHRVMVHCVYPGALNTRHAAHYSPDNTHATRRFSTERAARIIVQHVENNNTMIFLSRMAKLTAICAILLPRICGKIMNAVICKKVTAPILPPSIP